MPEIPTTPEGAQDSAETPTPSDSFKVAQERDAKAQAEADAEVEARTKAEAQAKAEKAPQAKGREPFVSLELRVTKVVPSATGRTIWAQTYAGAGPRAEVTLVPSHADELSELKVGDYFRSCFFYPEAS